MATKIEHQRAKYRAEQLEVASFGVGAEEFNAQVRSFLRNPAPTPEDWVFGAVTVSLKITQGRCCPKAVVVPCVCEVSYNCPQHGTRCRGSHD